MTGSAVMWSSTLLSASGAAFPLRKAITFTLAHFQPSVSTFVRAFGLHHVAMRTGSTMPRTASTM